MHCFICVTYMIFICSAHPGNIREAPHATRSLFRDVIESLRIRSQLPDKYNQHEENNLANYENYGFQNEPPNLPTDSEFVPRRNDRIELPPMNYRYPKELQFNETDNETTVDSPKEEIVVYIDTTKEPKVTTAKTKKPKRSRPTTIRGKPNKNKEDVIDEEEQTPKPEDLSPWYNSMGGQSQIGNRESQMVVKPTVIVNIRGTVSHRDSDIRIEGRTTNETQPLPEQPQNIFTINQDIKVERNFAGMGSSGLRKEPIVREEVKINNEKEKRDGEEDMMMCETATWDPEKSSARDGRKYDKVLRIMFSL